MWPLLRLSLLFKPKCPITYITNFRPVSLNRIVSYHFYDPFHFYFLRQKNSNFRKIPHFCRLYRRPDYNNYFRLRYKIHVKRSRNLSIGIFDKSCHLERSNWVFSLFVWRNWPSATGAACDQKQKWFFKDNHLLYNNISCHSSSLWSILHFGMG